MVMNCEVRFFLLLISSLTNIRSEKVLSDRKKCGDPECETSMSRVLAIKDHQGPDCRYLNFKAGEEIMVHFKLSGKREDLWAGSKGTDFGYFPTDAIKIENVFITKEVEVPTKETDFLCLDGEEYVFENQDSTLNNRDEENEYLHLHTEVSPKEYKDIDDIDEADSKSKDLHILEPTSHDSEIRDSKTGQAETTQQEDQNSQAPNPLPTRSSWTISGLADWFSSESKENEETNGKSSETAREVTFRSRQIPIMDDSDSKKLNEEDDLESKSSSWLKSTFTGLLQFRSEKAGLGSLYEENDPEILDSSSTAEIIEPDATEVSETTDEGEAKSNWFDLQLSDVLTFGLKGNKVEEEPPGREEIDQNKEEPPPSTQASLIHEDLRKQAVEAILSEEQNDEPIKQIVEPTLQKEQEKDDKQVSETGIRKASEHTDLEAAAPSFSTEFLDKIVNLYAEQDSEPRNQVIEHINVQAVMKESEKTKGQSGWYESLYSNIIDFRKDTTDDQPVHKSVAIQSSQESAPDQLQGLDPVYIQNERERNHEGPLEPQPFLSISYFTNALNFQGLLSKESSNIPGVEKELKSSKESTQSKKSDEILHINKESKILLNQNIIEKVSENRHVYTSQESIVSFSEAENQEEYKGETQDSELGKYKAPHHLPVKSKLRNGFTNGQCIQIYWNHSAESLEMQNKIGTKDKHMGHTWEAEQAFPVERENVNSLPGITSSERSTLMKEEPDGEETLQQKNEYTKNSSLEETEMYIDKESKGEKEMDDEVEISLVTHKNKFFGDAKEHSDNFAQSGDIPGEDDTLFDVGDENNLLIHKENEHILSEKSKVMGTEIRETIRKADSKSIDLNEQASTDQTNKNTQKEGASENTGQSPFSSHTSQDTDVSDITHNEEKHRQFEQPQTFLSLSHYRLLFSFQSFTDENMNALHGVQDDKSAKDEDSQSKSIVEILQRNKETEGNKQLYENMKQETSMNNAFSKKGILLTPSAEQDNEDTELVIKGAQSLTDTSEKYILAHTIDSVFRNQNLKEKGTEDKEGTNIKGKNQSFSGEEKDCVTDHFEKRELIESKPLDAIKDDFPLCTDYCGELNKSVVAKESLDQFSQEGDNEDIDVSEHLTESDEGKQHGEEDTENESNKPTNEEDSNLLNQQGLSIEATLQGVFENENEIEGLAGQTLSYDFVNVKQNPQDLQMQTDEKSSEEKHGPTTDNGQRTDSSSTAKVVYGCESQEPKTSYLNSGTFSKEMTLDLLYLKKDENEPKNEEVVTSSYLAPLDRDSSSFMGLEPDEKCTNQVACDTQIHLKAEKLKIDNILNNGGNKPELQEEILDVMPKLSKVTSEKNTLPTMDYDRLFQKRSVAENVASENPSLNLEVKRETLETDNNVEPSKLSPDDIPHHLETVGFIKDHISPHNKNSLDIHHLATHPDDETLEQNRITPLPKHLKWVEEPGHSEHVKDSQGKDQKVIENYEEIEHSVRMENTRRQGVMSNIFGKTSWFFGGLFQNKPKENFIENTNNGNIIATQAKVERQEADIVGSDFEEGKSKVQGTKASHYSHALKSREQESQGKMHSLAMKKSVTKDERRYNQKDDIQETEPVYQETLQNDKWITDAKLDLKEESFFTGFQETYIKLVAESKRILQANVCEKHELQLLAQEFEKFYYEITNFSCEGVYRSKKQMTVSLEDEHKLKIMHERCLKTKLNLRLELQSLVLDIRNNCAIEREISGTINKEQLPGYAPKEGNSLDSHNEPNRQHSEANNIPPVNTEEKMPTSIKKDQDHQDCEEKLPGDLRTTHNSFIGNEREWLLQIILHLNDFSALITSGLSVVMTASKKVVAALPENMRPESDLHGFPWEIVICGAVLSIFVVLLLVCRSYQSIRSRLYVGKEKQLASKVVELVEDKCKVLEKFSRCKKEYEELENSLKDASFLQGSTATSDLKKAYEELNSSNSVLKNEIALLEKEVREEKSKRSEQDDLMTEIQKKVEFLENEAKSIQSQVAEAKTTLKVYEINRERLKTSVQDALEENNHLQESQKQLLQEAEGWGERFSELNEQTKIFQCSKADMEEALKNKESQVKSLTECLLKMKDWSCAIGEHEDTEDSHWGNDIKCERENGEHLDDQEKRTIKKLIYAAKLNACLKSMETERNQMYSKLTDENKAKEELAERIENLQKEHGTLQSENAHFESEVQKLQQKLKVMSELYQENEMNLHRKLTVEERQRLQKEEKLSKADEKIIHAAEELNTYRQQAKDLEEELERTVRSYQNQIMSHEKKAHDNWLTARAAERHLNDLRKENLHNRQKLTEAEFKYDVLEKDPYALDVPVRPFGREHSPYGPSPMGRPSSETRAFLSPPTLLEGPLRLSPVLPGGGGRGSRGPGNAYDMGNERGEMNSDRLPDSHRPPSDTGSLSPPWDRDHRINPSHTGQLYNEQPLPARRPERFYPNHPNSGRFSGPGELRSYSMQSFDKTDGQPAENNSRVDLSGNGIKDHPNDSNAVHMADQSLVPESDPLGPGTVPPSLPLMRPPLMPMDPRGAFIRRGPPFPPVPPSAAYGPREYFPRDFAGLPCPLMPMRGPFPLRPFSQYPPPRAGFFPPLPPDNRNELPAESTHLSTASSTDHQESQET